MNIQGFNPTMAAPVLAQTASGAAATSSSSGSTSSTSASGLGTTFLNLLVTELQNQDPTSPVDPTQMVSQMVSLNQLDQLISINQMLTNMSSSAATSATSGSGKTTTGTPQSASGVAPATMPTQQPTAYTGAGNTMGLMNLYGSFGIPSSSFNSTFAGGR